MARVKRAALADKNGRHPKRPTAAPPRIVLPLLQRIDPQAATAEPSAVLVAAEPPHAPTASADRPVDPAREGLHPHAAAEAGRAAVAAGHAVVAVAGHAVEGEDHVVAVAAGHAVVVAG